ncbi:hypothetical protein ACJX0J_037679, partial [Zea mays]
FCARELNGKNNYLNNLYIHLSSQCYLKIYSLLHFIYDYWQHESGTDATCNIGVMLEAAASPARAKIYNEADLPRTIIDNIHRASWMDLFLPLEMEPVLLLRGVFAGDLLQ